ncbi:9060_t:CDS:1, partial [Funneliformis geosporum]
TKSSTIFIKDVEKNAEKSPTSTNDINDHSSTSTNDIDYHSDTKSSTNSIKDVETNAEKSPTSTNDIYYHSDAESSTTLTNDVDYTSNIEILPTLTNYVNSISNIEKSSSTIINHVESAASNVGKSSTFTNYIGSTSNIEILTNDANSDSYMEIIDLNEFLQLHHSLDFPKAFKLINDYAKQDPSSPKIKFWMGYYHYKGYHVKPNKRDAIKCYKYFEAAAKLNDPDAQYYCSHMIINNLIADSKENNRFEIALEYLKKAAEQNHPASLERLGKIMINGKFGCKKDIKAGQTLVNRSKKVDNRFNKPDRKVITKDGTRARKERSYSNASTISLKRNVYQRKSRTSSNASSSSSIRSMVVSKSFSSKKSNTKKTDQFRHSAYA